MARQILIKPHFRRPLPNKKKILTLIGLVDTVIDEAGDDGARSANAVIADLMQSGKIKWARQFTFCTACRRE